MNNHMLDCRGAEDLKGTHKISKTFRKDEEPKIDNS